jgi:hypothetical protein
MGRALLVAAFVVAATVAGCGNDSEDASPLTLEQRALTAEDAPGSVPDPVEESVNVNSLDDLAGLEDTNVQAARIDRGALEDAGFVAAVADTRFVPDEVGGAHEPGAPHVRLLVAQFESEEGAESGLDLVHEQSQERCPEECALEFEDFDVDGVPDARGVRRFATPERVDEVGEGEPLDSYTIVFADGVFVYALEGFGPPDAFTEEQVEEIAARLHDRVEGAPAADT